MTQSSNSGQIGGEGIAEIKKNLRMNRQLEGMRQAIDDLSIYMEKQENKQEEMEAVLKEKNLKYEKLANDSNA